MYNIFIINVFCTYSQPVADLVFKSCSDVELLSPWQDQTPRCVVFQTSGGCCCAVHVLRMRFKDYNANSNIFIKLDWPLVKCGGLYLAA